MNHPRLLPLGLAIVLVGACPRVRAQSPFVFPTGEPSVIGVGNGMSPMTAADYRTALASATDTTLVPARTVPADLSPNARYGFGITYGGRNRSWMLDTDARGGPTVYADFNANGDLTDDPPLVLRPGERGHTGIFRTTLTDTVGGASTPFTYLVRLDLVEVTASGADRITFLARRSRQLRQGVIEVGGRRMAFGLVGNGLFDRAVDAVYFDVDGDGTLSMNDENDAVAPVSPERYPARGGFVTLGETSYAYTVDRYGRSLTLQPLPERVPERAVIAVGKPVPDLTFTDGEGRTRRLSELRGRVVLLDFWGTWCAPCVAAVPRIAAAYGALRERGLEVLAINVNDEEADFRRFVAEKGMTWQHAREGENGPLQRLFHVRAFPTYFVVGRDGTLLATGLPQGDLTAALAAYLGP